MRHLPALALVPLVLSTLCCMASAESSPTPSPSPAAKTGIEGVVTRSPIHGGPIRQGVPSSGPMPNTAFVVRRGTEEVASFTTDTEGKYRVALPPGKYEVWSREQKGKFRGWGPFPVEVSAGEMKQMNFDCDTGMR